MHTVRCDFRHTHLFFLPSLTVTVNSSGEDTLGLKSTTSVENGQVLVTAHVSGSTLMRLERVNANSRAYLPLACQTREIGCGASIGRRGGGGAAHRVGD
jgi:hypothetical protein